MSFSSNFTTLTANQPPTDYFCRIDLGWINGIKPEKHGIRFVRPVTFASGKVCQMWFVREEKSPVSTNF
ncbi:hypothetical protein [Capnocytophaga canis]|uniref:hypothetical protein n=1 Tax=Capnocytophaga canis TaxID=1848903 RepID=UPI00385DB0E0